MTLFFNDCLPLFQIILVISKFMKNIDHDDAEAAAGGVLLEKVFLEISQNSQENTCVRVPFLIKLQASPFFNNAIGLLACSFIKKKLQHRCFPVSVAKILRTPILKNICERLLLNIVRILV